MRDPSLIAVLGTLDTKGREVSFLTEQIRSRGFNARTLDIGLRPSAGFKGEITREEVVAAGGEPGAPISDGDGRESAMETMARGAGRILRRLEGKGELAGVVAIGGSKGTWMATTAMRELAWGLPKVMIASTVAGDLRRYTGHRDILFMPSVVDLCSLNRMTRTVLARAAAAVCALAATDVKPFADGPSAGTVALSMAGIVTPCGLRVQSLLERRGLESIVFPANGAGGRALEETVQSGAVIGVIDLAAMELSNELVGGVCSAGPHRMEAAGQLGLPQVIVPGAVEIANFAGPEGVPPRLRRRRQLAHTPAITLVRLSGPESRRVGEMMATKLSSALGPVTVLIPTGGFSAYDHPGQPFWDPVADRAFIEGFRATVTPNVVVEERAEHVNDGPFADAVVQAFERELQHPTDGTRVSAFSGASLGSRRGLS